MHLVDLSDRREQKLRSDLINAALAFLRHLETKPSASSAAIFPLDGAHIMYVAMGKIDWLTPSNGAKAIASS